MVVCVCCVPWGDLFRACAYMFVCVWPSFTFSTMKGLTYKTAVLPFTHMCRLLPSHRGPISECAGESVAPRTPEMCQVWSPTTVLFSLDALPTRFVFVFVVFTRVFDANGCVHERGFVSVSSL